MYGVHCDSQNICVASLKSKPIALAALKLEKSLTLGQLFYAVKSIQDVVFVKEVVSLFPSEFYIDKKWRTVDDIYIFTLKCIT